MSNTKIKAGQFSGIVGHGTDGYFLMTNGDGTMAWAEGGATGPSVTSVSYPGDDTAADPAGGQTVVLTGTNFGSSMTVSIGGTTAPSVAHDSNTQLTITTPAKAAGDYDIVVTNTVTGASGTFVNGISYNGIPTWTTAAGSLGTFESETTISTITLQATEPDGGTITFNITNGALPTGLSLTGANIDGTTTAESSTTLYSFTIEAIDDENQSTPRNFSITVNSAAIISSENFTINTYTGNGSTQSIEGKIGTAASFQQSSTSKISLPFNLANTSFSISFWMANTRSGNNSYAVTTSGSGTGCNDNLHIGRNGGSGKLAFNFFCRDFFSSTNVTTDGTWQHWVCTYDASTTERKIYYNGSLDATEPTAAGGFTATANLQLGGNTNWAGLDNTYKGKLDQVRIFDKVLDSNEVTTLYGENNASSTKSTTDIFGDGSAVALYEFEEGAKDTGGVNGYIGAGGVFNGSSSVIDLGNNFNLTQGTGFSISMWVNPNSVSSSFSLISKDNSTSRNWTLSSFSGTEANPRFFIKATNASQIDQQFTSSLVAGTWSNLVITWNGGLNETDIKLYFNGVLESNNPSGTSSGTISDVNTNTQSTLIGDSANYNNHFNGKIDQVRIFNKAISSSEVTTLYGETLASATKSTTDIFDDGSAVALYELEGNANTTAYYPYGEGAIDSGQSAVFNGSSSSIVNTSFGISGNQARSYSAWVYTDGNTTGTICGVGDHGTAGKSMYFWIDQTNGGRWSLWGYTATYDLENQALSAIANLSNGWHHFVLTWNANQTFNVYIDGSLADTKTKAVTYNTPAIFAIGRWYDSGYWFNSKIDQVRIYSSALSASDVEALASETNVPTANLVAHYKLDGNANDETGSYNGTASNITYSDPAEFPLIAYNGTATNVSYAYDGTPTNVSFVGTSFQPDLVWIKNRFDVNNLALFDSIRGREMLTTSTANQGFTPPSGYDFTSFDSNGFTVAGSPYYININDLNDSMVAWCWKAAGAAVSGTGTSGITNVEVSANTDAGFSIVKYTGSGNTGATITHGLNEAPQLSIIKNLDSVTNWDVSFDGITGGTSLNLDTDAQVFSPTQGYHVAGASTLTLNNGGSGITRVNTNSEEYIAYCFHSVDGYQKVGSYQGTGLAGNTITTGFEPRFVMIKSSSNSEPWFILDSARDTSNPRDNRLMADSSAAEDDGSVHTVDFTSTGFTANGTVGNGTNGSGVTYIYLAIA